MTSIASELNHIKRMEYIESMSYFDLAHWLLNSFTPERYRAGNEDVVYYACKVFYLQSLNAQMAVEFYERLWGMHGVSPDKADFMHENVVPFRRVK